MVVLEHPVGGKQTRNGKMKGDKNRRKCSQEEKRN